MAGLGPNRRPTALIFQNLALFPLMRVWENVAFGLEARGWSRAKRRRRAEELLALVALEGEADKYPSALSGGQRQRMRAEIQRIQRQTGVTFVFITHDQGEALTMSDRVAVMDQGRIEQISTPDQIYNRPRTYFVAGFVGEQNVFPGRVSAVAGESATGTRSSAPSAAAIPTSYASAKRHA